jgi:protein phosphatase
MFWSKKKAGPKGPQGFGLTDVGLKRSQNEDALFFSDEAGLYLVADGMGGHDSGEVASALAVETVSKRFTASDKSALSLKEAIEEANHQIYVQAKEKEKFREEEGTSWMAGMGTTIVALAFSNETALIAHVGDSRIYRLRDARLERMTRDHSLAEEAAQRNGVSPSVTVKSGFKNVITRALGIESAVKVDLREEKLQEGDLFLLCSDGLTNMIPDNRIEEILSSGAPLQTACEILVKEANKNGGKDNISCILARYS